MKKIQPKTHLDRNPVSTDNILSGFSLGQTWFNTISGEIFYHQTDGVWFSISPSKHYSGLVSQAGIAAPTISILQDLITGVVLARTAAGTYTFTKIGAFTAGKTIPNKQEDYTDSDGNLFQMIYTSADVMTLKTYAAVNTSVMADGVLVDQFINIEIFN